MLNLILYILLLLTPSHDFHTSWMNMTYMEDSKHFEIMWRTDTEHLEGVLTAFAEKSIKLETNTVDEHRKLLSDYIKTNTRLTLNKNQQNLEIDIVEVTFAETIVHFKPIKCRRKLKSVSMQNTLLQAQFPNQKNMVQVNYKGKMYSMLLGNGKVYESVSIEK